MKMKQHLRIVCALVCVITLSPTILYANNESKTNDLSPVIATELNFKTFEVYVEEAGEYYCEFWLLPAKYTDGSYTTFHVYSNGEPAGRISPSDGNWQSRGLDQNETISLVNGLNRITIGTVDPEIPAVESVRIAADASKAIISSEAYDSFLMKAEDHTMEAIDTSVDSQTDAFISNVSLIQTFDDVPLQYAFYKLFNFTKNQEIFITSTSSEEHDIDMMFYGTKIGSLSQPQSTGPEGNASNTVNLDTIKNPGRPVLTKAKAREYALASSEQMQGLNWRGPSRKALNSSAQVATIHEKIPLTGVYLVRLRHHIDKGIGLANLNVNGTYYYENVPITFNYIEFSLPNDGVKYETFTDCNFRESDDPILFIHGAQGDRIVGFADDAPEDIRDFLGLARWDSYIVQQYVVPTSGLSVSNYSSAEPESHCNITTYSPQTIIPAKKSISSESNSESRISFSDVNIDSRTGVMVSSTSNEITVNATSDVRRITAYDFSGNRLGSVEMSSSLISVPVSELNIYSRGMYIINIETSDNYYSRKVTIR